MQLRRCCTELRRRVSGGQGRPHLHDAAMLRLYEQADARPAMGSCKCVMPLKENPGWSRRQNKAELVSQRQKVGVNVIYVMQ